MRFVRFSWILSAAIASLVGCYASPGTVLTPAGFVGGQYGLRDWLGFAQSEPLTERTVEARVRERYPEGTSIDRVREDAEAAGLMVVDRILRHTGVSDPNWPIGTCFQPNGSYEVDFEFGSSREIEQISVWNVEACF